MPPIDQQMLSKGNASFDKSSSSIPGIGELCPRCKEHEREVEKYKKEIEEAHKKY